MAVHTHLTLLNNIYCTNPIFEKSHLYGSKKKKFKGKDSQLAGIISGSWEY